MRVKPFAIGLCAIFSVMARADVITYTSRSAFDAAATTDFYAFPVADPAFPSGGVSKPFTFGPVTFNDPGSVAPGNFNGHAGLLYLSGPNTLNFDAPYLGDEDTDILELSFPATNTFGFEFDSFGGVTAAFFFTGPGFQYQLQETGLQFLGFVSSTPFNSLDITTNGFETDIFNYDIATAQTPEPSSIALLGTGLLGIAGVLRKRFSH